MSQIEPQNQFIEVVKLVLPIVTFLLGYIFSRLDKFFENKRKIKNMKTVFLKELRDNFVSLNKVIPKEKSEIPHPYLVADRGVKLSFSIYDSYLDRIDSLKPKELGVIFDAYSSMRNFRGICQNFMTIEKTSGSDKEKQSQFASLGSLVIMISEDVLTKIGKSLNTFTGGDKITLELEHERGSEVSKFEEIFDLLKKHK